MIRNPPNERAADLESDKEAAASLKRKPRVRRTQRGLPFLLLLPGGIFLGILIVATLMIFRMSFGIKGAEWSVWTIKNYISLGESLYIRSILLTLRLAFLSAVLTVVLGYPVAMFMARIKNEIIRFLVTFVLLLPLFVNLLFQSYGWILILSPDGIVNKLLLDLGLIHQPLRLIFTEIGVLIGLVQGGFPLAVLPIASALRNIPKSLEEAAATLGANRLSILWHILLPLSLPGVIAGSLIIVAFNASAFVVPFLLGGRRVPMLGVLIRDQMGPLLNWPFASANAVVLVVIVLIVLTIYQFLTARSLRIWRQ